MRSKLYESFALETSCRRESRSSLRLPRNKSRAPWGRRRHWILSTDHSSDHLQSLHEPRNDLVDVFELEPLDKSLCEFRARFHHKIGRASCRERAGIED